MVLPMPESEQKTYTFHVSGMHCNACILMTESELEDVSYVTNAKSSLSAHSVEVTGDFGDKTPETIAEELTKVLQPHGYSLSTERIRKNAGWGDFVYALPIALVLILGFAALQKAGLTNLITGSSVSYGTAFVIGLIASVSSCLAIVGGLVLSLSASSAKEGGTWRTQTLFHVGRLGGFFVLGGSIGLIGSSFHLGITVNVVLGILVALVMFILGVNLLDVFHFTKRLQVSTPSWLSRRVVRGSRHDHYFAPLLVGIGTFALPCGFTQPMQLYALNTGSFMHGG